MDENRLFNAQVDFFILASYNLKVIHMNVRATGHNVDSDTRMFRINYGFVCSITKPFMLTDFGIQCAYDRTIIHGHTFGATKSVNNIRKQGIRD